MRITSVIIALAFTWAGSINAQNPTIAKLSEEPAYKEGIDALTDHLPAIATEKFTTLLESENLSETDKVKLLFLLTESQIRSINPNEALKTLSDPLVIDHPDAIFWKGQALATAGRYNDAIQILELAKPSSKNYQLARFKIANLAAAINDTDKALTIINQRLTTNLPITCQSSPR